MLLKGRTALVTGASRGIGAATAKLLASHGATVVVNYLHSREMAPEVVATIRATGGAALALRADVRVREQVRAMVAEVRDRLGPVDTLVLNAGIRFPTAPILGYPWEAFEEKLTGELKAAFFCCQEVVLSMIERRHGCIVAVSSGLSRQSAPGMCAHSTAKSGLDALARSRQSWHRTVFA